MKKNAFNEDWIFSQKNEKKVSISLPHDAMQLQGRAPNAPSGSGGAFFLGGCYEYEKRFWVPEEWSNQDILLEFEGVYPSAKVLLNEVEIGGCNYGYSMFRVPLTSLTYGEYNEVKVIADNSQLPNTRWYSGAGIYRPVWLWQGEKAHIKPDGIKVTTLSDIPAKILVEIDHTGESLNSEDVMIEIFYQNEKVAESYGIKAELVVPNAKLWDADSPNLYQCKVSLIDGERVLDDQSIRFGIRKLSWSPNGLTINGKNILLKGGCLHHDHGILGARTFDKSEWRRVKRLKEYGFNAIRSSHNPASRALLEACDVLGMYVIDETWDMWYTPKNKFDYANHFRDNFKKDIESMISKDFNHPSVIMYSIGNEVTEPAEKSGIDLASEIIGHIHSLDDTRPLTAGINLTILLMASMGMNMTEAEGTTKEVEKVNSTVYNQMVNENAGQMTGAAATDEADKVTSPIFDLLDIAGYNYASTRYELEGHIHPERIVVGSETFPQDLVENWKIVEKQPNIIGDFMWTAWDYLGEIGLGSWSYESDGATFHKKYPWILADTGAFDILGKDNAEAGMASVVWGARDIPYIGVMPVNHPGILPAKAMWRGSNALPYWSYQQCEGNPAEIEIYSSAASIELFVNDKNIGCKPLVDYKAVFNTNYEPGTLKAIAYAVDGTVHSEHTLRSADTDTQICVVSEEPEVRRGEILYLDISLRGKNGELECNRDTCLEVQVVGGELLGFGSANPKTEEDFLNGKYTTYYGSSQAVVKVTENTLKVSVTGEDLSPVDFNIPVQG